MDARPINVLVVEDSPLERLLLTHILKSDPQIHLLRMMEDAEQALHFLATEKPDVVLMDIYLPGMNGFEATRQIMATHPVPIVICSAATTSSDMEVMFKALEAGALSFVEKPAGPAHPQFQTIAANLVQTLKLMSEVRVVKRHSPGHAVPVPKPGASPVPLAAHKLKVVAMGASTGGPPVLHTILEQLPKPFPLPVLVVQHIAAGFLGGLRDWLRHSTGRSVEIAHEGQVLLADHFYLAPDDVHLGVSADGKITLCAKPPENGLRPSVAHLFRSVADVYGSSAVGVLLTGMGRDGADELKLLRQKGATTIAQDRESSVVHGMPGEAIKRDAAMFVLPPPEIAATLGRLAATQS